MKLRTRLFALVILILLPILGVELYDEIEARRLRAEEGREQALRLVRLVGQEQSRVVEGARQLLTALGKTPVVTGGDQLACSVYLTDLIHSYPQYLGLLNINLSGHPICASRPIEPAASAAEKPYFKLALENRGFVIGEYDKDDQSHQGVIYLSQPYFDANGKIGGVVAVGLGVGWLNEAIARNLLPPKSTVSVIDRKGTILGRYPGADQFVGTKIANQSHSYLLSGREGVLEAPGFDGISRIFAYTPLPAGPPGLTLSVGLDKDEVLKGSDAANRRDVLVIAGSCVLALLLAAIGASVFIGRPIRLLLAAAEHWRQGDLDARVRSVDARSEFGRLGAAFNLMAAAIGAREQELEHRVRERTEALMEAMEAQHLAEAALYESRKVETVGRLTGGVAHDFNNLLAAIVGNIELAKARLAPEHPGRPRLDAALQSASRGAAMVQQLLAFARRQNLRPEVVDLNRYMGGSQKILQRLLQSDIAVETQFSPEAWLVQVDPNQLEAAILNLAINARDAMPHGGSLRLETRNTSFAEDPGRAELVGQFVALTIADSGTGIAPEILEKVFEPFFTTKEIGAGSGLGLSMVQGFARQSAGSVSITSIVGQGTSVTIFLPRTTKALVPIAIEMPEVRAGNGVVLLVDNDAAVPSMTADLLEMNGYSVVTVANATEAIAYVEQPSGRVDILVTDLVLADDLNGIGLAAAVHYTQPTLPVLLITGYSDAWSDINQTGGLPVLTKPFTYSALIHAVQEAMRPKRPDVFQPDVLRPDARRLHPLGLPESKR